MLFLFIAFTAKRIRNLLVNNSIFIDACKYLLLHIHKKCKIVKIGMSDWNLKSTGRVLQTICEVVSSMNESTNCFLENYFLECL